MARSYVRQNVVNRFELQPRSGERSYDGLSYSHVLANVATTVCLLKFRRNSSRDIRLRKILIRTKNNPGLGDVTGYCRPKEGAI